MTTERKITIGAILALVCYVGIDIAFHVKDKIAQARVDGMNQVREQAKKDLDAQLAARQTQYDKDKAAQDKQIADARKTIEGMAALVNHQVPAAPKGIQVVTGPLQTVTLHTGDAVIPAQSAPAYYDAFELGQQCQTDLKKCVGDGTDYRKKFTITQDQYDAEKNLKRRTKWGVLGEAACSAGGAALGAWLKGSRGAAVGAAVGGGVCGFKF